METFKYCQKRVSINILLSISVFHRKTLKCLSRDTESLDKNNMKDLKRLINKYESKLHR